MLRSATQMASLYAPDYVTTNAQQSGQALHQLNRAVIPSLTHRVRSSLPNFRASRGSVSAIKNMQQPAAIVALGRVQIASCFEFACCNFSWSAVSASACYAAQTARRRPVTCFAGSNSTYVYSSEDPVKSRSVAKSKPIILLAWT